MSNNHHGHAHSVLPDTATDEVTIREAGPGDLEGLIRLAQLDSARLPEGPMIIAEVAGKARAAVSLRTGDAIADPFHRTAGLISLLRMRARQLHETGSRGVRLIGRSRWATQAGAQPIA